jgi:hypothetical protein
MLKTKKSNNGFIFRGERIMENMGGNDPPEHGAH